MNDSIGFRDIAESDKEFLFELYASTRAEELALVDWPQAQKEDFLRMQFEAQHRFYEEQFADAHRWIIVEHGTDIGRLYVDRRDDEIRVIDIALLPAYRGRGIGTALLADILAEGERSGKPVRIHVERFNPALKLYLRLGFRSTGDNGVYYLMEWKPATAADCCF